MARILSLLLLGLGGCAQIPKGATPVTGFEVQRYLGTWYEIARLDHSFERGLTHVNAAYSLNPDGSVRVLNRGYNPQTQRWKEATGRAVFVGARDVGQLRVSFFGPFYGAYNIIALDTTGYGHALICSHNLSYLWILARTPTLPEATVAALKQQAALLGFDTAALILVPQADPPAAATRSGTP